MSEVHAQAQIDSPISAVWALVGDPTRYPEWLPRTLEVQGERFDEGDEFVQVSQQPLFGRTEARRCLGYVHYTRREWDAAISAFDEVLELIGAGETAVSRLLMGAWHVRALIAAGRLDEAEVQLVAFERLAGACQSRHASDQAAQLRIALNV